MKKFLAILISASIFLAQINIVSAQSDITVSGGLVNIDLENSILYTSSDKIAVRDLQYLISDGYSVTGYTDSSKSDEYSGYLDNGNVVTLTKGSKNINLTVKKVMKLHNIDEDFESLENGSKPYDFVYWQWIRDLTNSSGTKTGSSTVTYEGINASDTNKRAKLCIKDTAGNSGNLVAHSRNQGIKGPAVLSLDMLNATPNNGSISVQIEDSNGISSRKTLFTLGSQISYIGTSTKENNTNSTELKTMYALLDPYEKKVKIYYDGELKSETVLDTFNYSDFLFYVSCDYSVGKNQEFTAYIDNLKLYENASINEDFAIKVVDYQKNDTTVSDLHSGSGKITVDIGNLKNKNSELTLYACKYNDKKLTDVLVHKNITLSSDDVSESIDIDTGDCTYDDIVKVMIWETDSHKPVYNQDIYMKNIVFKPFADEVLKDFNDYNIESTNVHPRILINNNDLERIKNLMKSDTTVSEWYDDIMTDADSLTKLDMSSEIKYYKGNDFRILPYCKKALEYILVLGIAYKSTSQTKYSKKAIEILDIVCNDFPDWNDKDHFLDTGLMAQVVAIGYDWFYGKLTSTQKTNYENAMINKGIQKGLNQYKAGAWWVADPSNWNAECNGGLMMAAMAIIDKYPAISSQMLEYGINNLQYCIDASYPDGGWFEGPTYGLGAMHALALVIDSLESTFGKDYGLTKILGFDRVGDFLAHIEGPVAINNYSDAGEVKIDSEVIFWLADKFEKYENALIQVDRQESGTPLALLWYSNEIKNSQEAEREKDAYFTGVEAVTMREDWNDSNSLWLSFCGGASRASHSHLDCGAFVLDWGGYRWACDLGSDNYNLPKYQYDAYRTRAEGHNTLVINPDDKEDQVGGTAVVTEKSLNVSNPYAIVDLSPVYDTADATSVKRGFKLMNNRSTVFIRDEIKLAKESDIYWFMHSKADLTLQSDNRVLMSQGEKNMLLEFVTDAESYDISIVDAKPMETSPTVTGQDSNVDYKKIQIHMKDSDSVNLTVRIIPNDGASHTSLGQISALENWGD